MSERIDVRQFIENRTAACQALPGPIIAGLVIPAKRGRARNNGFQHFPHVRLSRRWLSRLRCC